MKLFVLTQIFTLLSILSCLAISAHRVAIVYNIDDPDSADLARTYSELRGIPTKNIIGLKTSKDAKITRDQYNKTIRDPLFQIFEKRGWWGSHVTDTQGVQYASHSKIDLIVCMRGIPFMIQPPPKDPENPVSINDLQKRPESAVDSELTLLGVKNYPVRGAVPNQYYGKDFAFRDADLKGLLLTGRIDGPSTAICLRMMRDAILTEKSGLWGMAYIDKAAFHEEGNKWLDKIASRTREEGFPTLIDKNRDTFMPNYPMEDAALYFGWYEHHRNGPFLNPKFQLKRGSIAIHIHSYSGMGMRVTNRHWTGSILDRGATVTAANMYEPGLTLTHHLDIFFDRLLKGYTIAEAAGMSSRAISWQNTMIGDPLYRPFKITSATDGKKLPEDATYRAIRIGKKLWKQKPRELREKLMSAGERKKDGRYLEYLALEDVANNSPESARILFQQAIVLYKDTKDKLRNILSLADIERQAGNKENALKILRKALPDYEGSAEQVTLTSLITILDPPPPPPAQPGKPAPPSQKKK